MPRCLWEKSWPAEQINEDELEAISLETKNAVAKMVLTFMVVSAAEEAAENYVEGMSVRMSPFDTVAALRSRIVEASQLSATPLDADFASRMKLVLGDSLLLNDDAKRLEAYAPYFDAETAPRGYAGVLHICNGVAGAPLASAEDHGIIDDDSIVIHSAGKRV